MRLLVIEDHRAMRDMIANYFRGRGFAADAVGRGEDALAAVATVAYDAVIIDLGLPDMDGMEVLRRLRSEAGAHLPALIVTARDGIVDRISGLDAGADDYVLKPFNIAELEARIRAVLRRPGSRKELFRTYGDVRFDPASRTAFIADTPLDLTRREAAVLETLWPISSSSTVSPSRKPASTARCLRSSRAAARAGPKRSLIFKSTRQHWRSDLGWQRCLRAAYARHQQ